MIKLEKTEVVGWEAAIRGMRNPMNSWEKSDSDWCWDLPDTACDTCRFMQADGTCNHTGLVVGPNDLELMMKLAKGGPVHAKYRRMIEVYVDITAPLYWWKEFDTYKVGTVANSCSTMHKIHAFNFDRSDFSCEKLLFPSLQVLDNAITALNFWRNIFINGGHVHMQDGTVIDFDARDKRAWEQMIQLLPSSYNQKRTVMMSYEVLVGIYRDRKNHKLDEWHTLCDWIEGLPYSEVIIGEKEKEE